MSRPAVHAIIVGGGIAGLTIARALALRGVSVDLFEQDGLPNSRSSSFDEHRINRHAYGLLPGYSAMMPDAYQAWDRLWHDLGMTGYEDIGATYFLRGDDGWSAATLSALDRLGIAARDVPIHEVDSRFPMIEPAGLDRVIETAGAGMLFPNRILNALVPWLAKAGVRLHAYRPVDEVDVETGRVRVAGQSFEADIVIVCAGAWTDRLVPAVRQIAVPSRQAVVYLAPPPALQAAWATMPVMVTRGAQGGLYAMPPRFGTRLKVGDHRFSRTGDPDDDRTATDADLAPLLSLFEGSFRNAGDYQMLEKKACFYTVTGDESFHVRPAGASSWCVTACSGHGFKLAPLIADGVASAILDGIQPDLISEWAAGRRDRPFP